MLPSVQSPLSFELTSSEARITVLLAVWNATLDAQPQVVVMSNGHEEYTQDHGSQSESKHLTCSPRSSDLSGTVPLDETNHSSQDERRRGR